MSEEQPTPPPVGEPEHSQPVSPPVPQLDYSQPPQAFRPQPIQPQAPTGLDRLIPTKNARALIAYYLGVFSLIPCAGLFLGAAALILGILGLKECKRDANLPGKGHAITGIVLGSITFLANGAVVALVIYSIVTRPD